MGMKLRVEKPFVKDNTDRIISAESQITQNATAIASRVTVTTFNALENRVGTTESTIVQNANSITARVSGAENSISTLQQTSSSITASLNTTTHTLNSTGYILKDSNGSALITPNGVANEQNIGRVDNVENGYPMKLPFHIGSEISQITQAVLKWDIAKFRTYSKGAASGGGVRTTPSGGGSTSGASSKSTTGAKNWGSSYVYTTRDVSVENYHLHTVKMNEFDHSHDIAHTHTTPSHSHSLDITHEHAPVFGILEQSLVDYAVMVVIDGVHRVTTTAQRGEIDLSTWITTSGWHTIELHVNNLMRIDANLFLKTYIRR